MTTDLEKQEQLKRLYKHFGFTGENIQSQKQVLKDTCNILKGLGFNGVQSPDCVSISTENGIHRIINYWFDVRKELKTYRDCISFEIKKDYKLEELEDTIKQQVQALFKE